MENYKKQMKRLREGAKRYQPKLLLGETICGLCDGHHQPFPLPKCEACNGKGKIKMAP